MFISIEPNELVALCRDTKDAWLSLGNVSYDMKPAEASNIRFRRSIYFVKDISAGDEITNEHIKRIRPGFGLPPKFEKQLLGKTVKIDIKCGTATSWELINE